MAIISQEEIDGLLGQMDIKKNLNLEENTKRSSTNEEGNGKPSKVKILKARKNNYLRYHDTYISPVVKSEQIIYNPNPKKPEPENGVIVRSLENWNAYAQKQKEQKYY